MYIKKNVNNFIDNNGRLECENNKWTENAMKNTTNSINSARGSTIFPHIMNSVYNLNLYITANSGVDPGGPIRRMPPP
jgi:hypothetical protein